MNHIPNPTGYSGRQPTRKIARYTMEALEESNDLGPAMQALTPLQRGFVMALYDLGDHPSHVECAYAAGYTGTDNSMRVNAHRIAHNPKVQAAIREEADRRAITLLPMAHRRITEKLLNVKDKDNFAVAKHIQALGGIAPKTVHVIEHVHDRKALIQEITASMGLLKSLGVSIGNELIPVYKPEATDAEFEEVGIGSNNVYDEGADSEVPPGSEGLEDLL